LAALLRLRLIPSSEEKTVTKTIYVGALALVACAITFWALRSPNSSSEPAAAPARAFLAQPLRADALPSATATMDATATIDTAQLRSMIREEIAAASGGATSKAQPADAPAPVSADVLAQREVALQAINAAVAGGVWGEDERLLLHQNLALLAPEQIEQALKQVVRALNDGQLQVTTKGPPF
jgi:hypothetical protein